MNTTQTIIQHLRALGLSQAEIAAQAGLTQCTVSRWGSGIGSDSADAGIRLARIVDSRMAGIAAKRKTRTKAAA